MALTGLGFSSTGRDRISELPDDILSCILSHLTLRDAVKTSILSHRWGRKDPSREEKDKFVKAVNQFLKFHAGTKIVSFVVSFRLGNDYKNDVDEWIRSAIGMGAERLTLCLSVQDGEQIDF
nr:putative F-box protein At1g32020 [Quercus suber]XP_023916182.1 putative F-box protein At1g32020 [Quercus suber]